MAHAFLVFPVVDDKERMDHAGQPSKERQQQADEERSRAAGEEDRQGRQEKTEQVEQRILLGYVTWKAILRRGGF